jgi:hypothetical protein
MVTRANYYSIELCSLQGDYSTYHHLGPSESGGRGTILADQLILFLPDHAHHITTRPLGFWDLPTALPLLAEQQEPDE